MIDDEQNIRDFVNYGSNKFASCTVISVFSILEAVFFAVIYFVSNTRRDIQTALFGMIFFLIYALFIFIYLKVINKYEKSILTGYINNCVVIFSFSLLTIYMLIFVLVHMYAGILNYALCFSLYFLFSIFNIVNTVRKIRNGVFGEYLKPGYKVNNKFISAIMIASVLAALAVRISIKYVNQAVIMIIMEIILMILLFIYSIGNANFIKVYYILKYKIS